MIDLLKDALVEPLLDALIRPKVEKLTIAPCEMVTVENYARRMERIAPEDVESECGPAKEMLLVAEAKPEAQEFIGTGDAVLQVYPQRREEE